MACKLLNRRNFLQDSTKGAVGYLCLPSLATLLHSKLALGSTCPTASNSTMPAFIAVDLDGGASIAGNNVIVYDEGGNLLSSYEGLGLPNDIHPSSTGMIDKSLGLPMHSSSAMLRGIKAIAAAEVLAKTNGVVICTRTTDDTNKNELATAPGAYLAGARGQYLPLVGSDEGNSGGNSIAPFASGVAPVRINSLDSAQQIINRGEIWQSHPNKMQKVLDAIRSMSSSQLQKFTQMGLSEQTRAMIECGYLSVNDLLKVKEGVSFDPRQDSSASGLMQAGEVATTIAYLVLKGYAGSGTVRLPGYDYHDGTATLGEREDMQAGQVLGMMLQMAANLQRKLMIHVYTDGGVDPITTGTNTTENVGGVNKFKWVGDSEMRSAAYVLVYDPSGRPALNFGTARQQLGAYKSDAGGTLNLSPSQHAKISGSAEAQAQVVVANWLAWQGQASGIFNVMSNAPVTAGELDDYLFMSSS